MVSDGRGSKASGPSKTPAMLRVPVSRRAFLQAAGVATAGIAGARVVLAGASHGEAAAPAAGLAPLPDPIATLAEALVYDPERIFRFVADEIGYEPYAGVLRGARGTLASRAGNSADQAVLLAALLDAAFTEHRFVIGAIDDDSADDLWQSAQVDIATAQTRVLEAFSEAPFASLGSVPGVAPSAVPALASLPPGDADAASWAAMLRDAPEPAAAAVLSMADAALGDVVTALADAGITSPDAPSTIPDLERTGHVWLQIQRGSDWVDLDPTIPGAAFGDAVASGAPSDTLPDDLHHRVTVRAIVEQTAAGGLENVAILEHTATASELYGQPMVLLHQSPDDLKGVGVAITSALEGVTQYQPVLLVGDTAHVGAVGMRFADAAGDGGAAAAFGGSGDGIATAEWLETTVASPDGRTSVARRALFDRIGGEVRATGAVDAATLPEVELVRTGPDDPGEYPPLAAVHYLAATGGATTAAVLADLDTSDESLWVLRVAPHLFHLSRDAANAIASIPRGARTFHDVPNIVRWSAEVLPGTADGTFESALDVLHQGFGSVPVVGALAAAPPGIVAGVVGMAAERQAMTLDDPTVPPEVSVGAVFEQAHAADIPIRVIRPGDPLDALPYPAAARGVLAAALADGWVAIAPEQPVDIAGTPRIGWWLFDPVTGALADQMDDGRGVTMIERAIQHAKAWLSKHKYAKLGLCVALTVYEAYEILHIAHEMMSGGSEKGLAKGLAVGLGTGGAAHKAHHFACGH